MRLPLAIPAFLAAMSTPVFAQTATDEGGVSLASGGSSTIKQLLSSGYEIKASVPNGSKFIVFMQKTRRLMPANSSRWRDRGVRR